VLSKLMPRITDAYFTLCTWVSERDITPACHTLAAHGVEREKSSIYQVHIAAMRTIARD
jgi:hypothetical protein